MATEIPEPLAHSTTYPQQSRSPSPVAPPPLSAAPGPRASAIQKLYQDAITHILKTCNYDNFASCFPTPAQNVPPSMKQLHESFLAKIREQLIKTYEEILEDRKVVRWLNELDRLLDDAKREGENVLGSSPGVIPPHQLPAVQLYLAHITPFLEQNAERVKQKQEQRRKENLEIAEKVARQRREIEEVLGRLEGTFAKVRACAEVLGAEDVEALRGEVREVDEGLRS
ncbi:Nnf1 [Teratosphaeria destructans]|uniref:Nnf1 n=1 Tax=Teratosphaeria destructans TaxID=418781 RepID=A0A9W7SQS7_9PEZI|nr:Nnf1 [Teratosphaeria destructans]